MLRVWLQICTASLTLCQRKPLQKVVFGILNRFKMPKTIICEFNWSQTSNNFAKRRCREKLIIDSERATPTSYKCSIVTFVLTRTDWKLFDILLFAWDFPTGSETGRGFREKWPSRSENLEKHLLRGHFLASVRVFWAIVRWNRFRGLGCRRVKEFKNTKKARDRYISPLWGGKTAESTKFCRVGGIRDLITLAKFQINWSIIVALVSGWS